MWRRGRQHGSEGRIRGDSDVGGGARDALGPRCFPRRVGSAGCRLPARLDGDGICEPEESAHACARDVSDNRRHEIDAPQNFLGRRLRAVRRRSIDGVQQIVARRSELIGGSQVVRSKRRLGCGKRCASFRHSTPAGVVVRRSGREMRGDVGEMARDGDGGVGRRRPKGARLRHSGTPERERQEHHDEQAGHRTMIANVMPKNKLLRCHGARKTHKERPPKVVFPSGAPMPSLARRGPIRRCLAICSAGLHEPPCVISIAEAAIGPFVAELPAAVEDGSVSSSVSPW